MIMKYHQLRIAIAIIVISFFSSCKTESADLPVAQVKKDTLINEYQKAASRDPKKFISDCRALYAEARRMDSILLKELEVDQTKGYKAIEAFSDYANYCASDSLAPVFLIKTAQVAKSINNVPQAKKSLDKCIADYPNFRNRPAAIFLLAQLYDEAGYLNDEQEAKRLYEKILNEYPKSEWAASAKGALMFIGKSDAELLEELKKKNKS